MHTIRSSCDGSVAAAITKIPCGTHSADDAQLFEAPYDAVSHVELANVSIRCRYAAGPPARPVAFAASDFEAKVGYAKQDSQGRCLTGFSILQLVLK